MLPAIPDAIPEASRLNYEEQGDCLESVGLLLAKGQLDLLAVGPQLQVPSYFALACYGKKQLGPVVLRVVELHFLHFLLLVVELMLEMYSLGKLLVVDGLIPLLDWDLLEGLLFAVAPPLELHSQGGCVFELDRGGCGLLTLDELLLTLAELLLTLAELLLAVVGLPLLLAVGLSLPAVGLPLPAAGLPLLPAVEPCRVDLVGLC